VLLSRACSRACLSPLLLFFVSNTFTGFFFFSCQRIQLRKHDATVEDLRKEIARLTEEKRLENENKMLNERVTRAENNGTHLKSTIEGGRSRSFSRRKRAMSSVSQ